MSTISGTIYDTNGTTKIGGAIVSCINLSTGQYMPKASQAVSATTLGTFILDYSNLSEESAANSLVRLIVYYPTEVKFGSYDTMIKSTNETGASITLKACVYTTPFRVIEFLQLKGGFGVLDGDPNIVTICNYIRMAEDEVDNITHQAWRTRYSNTTSGEETSANYIMHTPSGVYHYLTGSPIFLRNRNIKTLAAISGDALGVWNGSEWEDWIANKTESRASDFWLDYENGILYIRGYMFNQIDSRIRIKYRYGLATVPNEINQVTAMIAARMILLNEDRSVLIPKGTNGISVETRAESLRKEIETRLLKYCDQQLPDIGLP